MSADLALLYGDRAAEVQAALDAIAEAYRARIVAAQRHARGFDQTDAVVIAYPDHLQRAGEAPLATLHRWLLAHVSGAVSTVHVLPFHPSTSYEGYAITDYEGVEPRFGTWDDLHRMHDDFELMFDFVLNHCSASHPWFTQFRRDEAPGRSFFITEADPHAAWLDGVYRARSSPLLHPVETAKGVRQVWTTYSEDLVDLDWREPALCVEMCRVLLDAVAHGARVIRLDAFVYIWKKAGTRCLDLPEGQALIRVFQRLLAQAGGEASAILPSITNVGQDRNVLYFGDGGARQADLIYNLPLSALLLQALYAHDTAHLEAWMRALPPAPSGCAYLNLTASHDGVGLTWLAGLLPEREIAALIAGASERGALVSLRKSTRVADERPWELNATYFHACAPGRGEDGARHVDRFLATQAVLLGLRGVPALYLTSLLAGTNDYQGVEASGDKRAINRGRFHLDAWEKRAANARSAEAQVLARLTAMLRARRESTAFHPEGAQEILRAPPGVFAFVRTSPDRRERMLCVTSFREDPVALEANAFPGFALPRSLSPYAALWIAG